LRRDRQATISDLEAREAVARRIVRSSFERPGRVLASWLLLAAVASLGVFRLEVETSTDSVLDRSGEGWRFYQEVQERFGGDEIVVLVIEGREPFDPGMLAEVVRITNALEELPGVRRVDSLATVPLVRATADADISLDAALAGGVPTEAEARDRLARRLRADRIAPRNLVSDSGRAVAVNVLLEQGPEARYGAILGAVDRVRGARSAWVSGVPVFRNVADARTAAELTTFVPLTLALVGTLLFALFGSMRAVLIPLVASGVGIWVMLGAMGAVGVPLTISTVILPSVLLALGCAYSMHNLAVAAGCRTPQELGDALESVALPITLSGLTTAVGFVAVSLVRIEVIRDVGAFGALGVLVVVAATLTAAPAALRLWPLPVRRNGFRDWLGGPAARGLIGFVGARRGALLLGWSVALAVVAVGIARVRVESDVVLWFPRHDPIRVAYEAIRERFSGISPMNVVIEAPEGASVTAPEVVAALGGLTTYLETLPEVGRALSLADPLRQLHRGFMGGVDERVPKRADLIEQYLLILESTEYVRDLVTWDRQWANVPLRVNDNGSEALLRVAANAERWWTANGPQGYRARTTGIMYEFARAEDEIAFGQLRGLAFAILVIGLILLAIFRSPRLAAVALVPNALPVAMAFGTMGLIRIPLDAGTVLVGNLALGIAVDDTIHVVTGFYRERTGQASVARALLGAFERVLPPVVFTTLGVSLGFAVLGFSGFTFTRNLGIVTTGIMLLCLARRIAEPRLKPKS
jgi:predicted RND superfamily exporter protein